MRRALIAVLLLEVVAALQGVPFTPVTPPPATPTEPDAAGRVCLRYRAAPAESTAQHVNNASLNVHNKQGRLFCDHRKFQDFPAAAFAVRMTGALLDSGDGTLRQQSMQQLRELVAGGAAGHEVVAWFDGLPSARQQLWPATIDQEAALLPKLHKVLSDENHFQIYSRSYLGEVRSYNRMIKFSQNAQVVVLVTDMQASLLTPELVATALDAFHNRPALALLGMGAGKVGVKQYGAGGEVVAEGDVKLVDKLLAGPLLVRRDALLSLGLLAHTACPGACEAGYEQEVSLRAWLAGWEVALLGTGTTGWPPLDAACTPDDLQAAIPGMYGPQHLTLMRDHVAEARQAPRAPPALEGCSSLPVPALPSSQRAATSQAQTQCDGIIAKPTASMMVQYFKRPKNIKGVMKGLRQVPEGSEVMINNDSGDDHAIWRAHLSGAQHFLVYSHDIHEIRAYNRLGLMADSELLITLQDDDTPSGSTWVAEAAALLAAHPRLIYITGYRARAGAGGNIGDGRDKVSVVDPATQIKFHYVYKLVAGPLFFRRSTWVDLGMFNLNFSCAGDPGIHFEYEYSLRTWYRGYHAGIYDCNFNHHVGDWASTGTRANKKVSARRRTIGVRNSMNVRFMYRDIHGNAQSPLPLLSGVVHSNYAKGLPQD